MSWEQKLEDRLEALGSSPSADQLERLESWILDHVPEAYWGEIAFDLPRDLATKFSMRSSELGYY